MSYASTENFPDLRNSVKSGRTVLAFLAPSRLLKVCLISVCEGRADHARHARGLNDAEFIIFLFAREAELIMPAARPKWKDEASSSFPRNAEMSSAFRAIFMDAGTERIMSRARG